MVRVNSYKSHIQFVKTELSKSGELGVVRPGQPLLFVKI